MISESGAAAGYTGERSGYIHLTQAARVLEVSQRDVRSLVGRGKLEVKRSPEGPASRPMVSVASVQRLLLRQQADTTT